MLPSKDTLYIHTTLHYTHYTLHTTGATWRGGRASGSHGRERGSPLPPEEINGWHFKAL